MPPPEKKTPRSVSPSLFVSPALPALAPSSPPPDIGGGAARCRQGCCRNRSGRWWLLAKAVMGFLDVEQLTVEDKQLRRLCGCSTLDPM
jgi:hypothetical protein